MKVGDKVKVLHSNAVPERAVGKIGIIAELQRADTFGHRVWLEDLHSYWYLGEGDLQLVKSPPVDKADRYNANKLRWRNFPLFLIRPLIEVAAAAEKHPNNPRGKYETWNFLKGMPVSECLDSLKRHLDAYEDPTQPDTDPESGQSHLAHIAWNALAALYYQHLNEKWDDRYKRD